jgi:hypothetical protein
MLNPGAFVAATQPLDVTVLLRAVLCSRPDGDWVVMGEAALWLYDEAEPPSVLHLGVPLSHKLAASSPQVSVRRVAASVLRGQRALSGYQVVALEVAVIQAAAAVTDERVMRLVEDLVRGRKTTIARLRARCVRGFKGSARVRAVCDQLSGCSLDLEVRRLKKALEARGVTDLKIEVRFENAQGASAYADLLHLPSMTVFEVDGFVEHTRRDRFRADRRRDRWMRRSHAATTLRIDVMEVREDLDALADELAWFVLPPEEPTSAVG